MRRRRAHAGWVRGLPARKEKAGFGIACLGVPYDDAVTGYEDPRLVRIASFLDGIGIEMRPGSLPDKTFFPGIRLTQGSIVVDEAYSPQPGDVLHEAGHLAVLPPARRAVLDDVFVPEAGEEGGLDMAATAWSHAAGAAIGFEPAVVFYPGSFKGEGEHLHTLFSAPQPPFGLPLLQLWGMTCDSKSAGAAGVAPYPHMTRWLRA